MAPLPHFVYVLRCKDGTLYTGYARDPLAREDAHNHGRGARYTASRRPVRLIYFEVWGSRSIALKREYALKQLSRAEKDVLVGGRPVTAPDGWTSAAPSTRTRARRPEATGNPSTRPPRPRR